MRLYDKKLKKPSQELRNNMTEAEEFLWSKLRMKQLKGFMFSRQKPLGGYIVDFYCYRANLVIEVDGGHHFTDENKEYDKIRDEFLGNMGLTVLRFTNSDVIDNIEGVVSVIDQKLP